MARAGVIAPDAKHVSTSHAVDAAVSHCKAVSSPSTITPSGVAIAKAMAFKALFEAKPLRPQTFRAMGEAMGAK